MAILDQSSLELAGSTFAFVDGLNNTYSTRATRSHVMTNAYREKKKLLANNKGKRNKTLVPKTWTFEVHSNGPPTVPLNPMAVSDASTPELTFSASGSPLSETFSDFTCSDEELLAGISSHSSFQPRTIIPAGLVDHFATLPVARTPIIDEFVAAYLGPPYDYGLGKRPSMAFNYRRARFRASLNDECSFYAMLSWLGRRAQLTGDWTTMLHSMRFKGKCMNIIAGRLRDHQLEGKDVDEGMMYGALDLSNGELRNGNVAAAKVHWQGLRDMVIAKGGLGNLIHHVPLIYSIVWNYMALGFDQDITWDYMPPICAADRIDTHDTQICAEELIAFISRLQEPSTHQYLTQPTIVSALSSKTLLHAALCSTNGRLCLAMRNDDAKYCDNLRGSEFDLALCAGRRRNAQEIPPHTYVLRNMQSPRPAILVFILFILLSIKDKAAGPNEHLLVPTLSHLFLAMEKALHEIDFDWYPYDLETVLTYLIRGIDLFRVSCPCLTGPCLLCGGGVYKGQPKKGSLFEGERFPDWPIVFAVARVMGGMRKLQRGTRRKLEAVMRELFFAGDPGSGARSCVLGCDESGVPNELGNGDGDTVYPTALGSLKETICLELGVRKD
ncbi:uncharacterized protein LY89DRAFT_787540 [Mollisia scopiformis]|uniref:Uncharacterized protein n=1 Tax=Mollisia scopiformis TaxID=149040 RepID=A0A132BEU2_MOLSC|nr:uncharacterized protein LY89DRAFT_787540 [Mollisia scopiformis]KUJ10529.1 hypothetical protein LY89DRAFT_787540 [Mollisia scopiformis]